MLKEIVVRFRLESPKLFVRLQNLFISLFITAGTIAGAIKLMPKEEIPSWVNPEHVKTGIILGVIGFTLSKLVVKDGNALDQRLGKIKPADQPETGQ